MLIDYNGVDDVLSVIREGCLDTDAEEIVVLSDNNYRTYWVSGEGDGRTCIRLDVMDASVMTPEGWFANPVREEIEPDFIDAADRWISVSIESQKIFAEILEIADLVEKEDSVPMSAEKK